LALAATLTPLWTEKPLLRHDSNRATPLLAQQALVAQQHDHRVAEQPLGRHRVDER